MLRTAWTLARKDLVLFFRDRIALLIMLALPILLATVFGSAMKGMLGSGGDAPKKVTLLFQDDDGSAASAALRGALEGTGGLRVVDTDDARGAVRNGDAAAGLFVPAGYGVQVAGGEIPTTRLLRDPSQAISLQVISGNLMPALLEATVQGAGPHVMRRALAMLDFPERGVGQAEAILQQSWEGMDHLVEELTQQGAFDGGDADEEPDEGAGFNFLEDVPALLGVEAEDVAGSLDEGLGTSGGASHAFAAIAVMMLMFALVGAGGSLLEERENGTLLRLQLTPAAGPAILTGKLITLACSGLLQLLVLFVYGWVAFEVPVPRHLGQLALISVVLVFTTTGLGLLFATACRTRKQLEGVSTVVILVMSAVGGAWFPREITPDWFQTAGLFTITAWAMDAYHGVLWYDQGILPSGAFDGVWLEVCVLFAIGVVLHGLAAHFYRRRFGLRA
jgi:ABC-2 type transport system permease protein